MLYLSLALIFLGILIFVYSIILDAKERQEGALEPIENTRQVDGSAVSSAPQKRTEDIRHRDIRDSMEQKGAPPVKKSAGVSIKGHIEESNSGGTTRREREGAVRSNAGVQSGSRAVLYEDSSHVIDYGNEAGSIDPSLAGYKSIKRVGGGELAVGKGGITFHMGKKLYRYDFHRVLDMKSGSRHMALFLDGSDSVKLFIVESGHGIITDAGNAYQEYLRSPA